MGTMGFRLAAMTAGTLLLTACASTYQQPTATEAHARVKFVASESMVSGSAYISPTGCTYPPAKALAGDALLVASFGARIPPGLPLSPGESLDMPGARFSPGFTTEKRLRAGLPVTMGFHGVVNQGYGRYHPDPSGKSESQVGHHVSICSAAITFTPQAGEDYMLAWFVHKAVINSCLVVPERYDKASGRWVPLNAAHQPRRAPVCAEAKQG